MLIWNIKEIPGKKESFILLILDKQRGRFITEAAPLGNLKG